MKSLMSFVPLFLVIGACAPSNGAPVPPSEPAVANRLSSAQQAQGWRLLFDGRSIDQWRGYKQTSMPAGWQIVDGAMTKEGEVGDLVSKDKFGDFELAFDWKIGPEGNSGMFYRGTEEYSDIYWSAPEYQLLDDAGAPDGKNRMTAAGSSFALYPSPAGIVKPAGEWNSSRILARGAHVEHWLNGVKLLEFEQWSPDWDATVKASKFKAWPHFGLSRSGYLGIQGNHPGSLALRNIRIRELR